MERRCTECDKPLGAHARKDKKTCGDTCRKNRSQRIANARRRGGQNRHPEHMRETAAAAAKDVAAEVAREEIRPYVREAMTDDVLQSVGRLVSLQPKAIDMLERDLESSDETIRQRAYTLLLRYTMGNPSVAPASAEIQPAAVSVVFNVPRPSDAPEVVEGTVEDAEPRKCVECDQPRPDDEFVAASDRCVHCHADLQARVNARFGEQ